MVLTATVKNKALMSMKQPMGITYMALRRRSPDEKKILTSSDHPYSK